MHKNVVRLLCKVYEKHFCSFLLLDLLENLCYYIVVKWSDYVVFAFGSWRRLCSNPLFGLDPDLHFNQEGVHKALNAKCARGTCSVA